MKGRALLVVEDDADTNMLVCRALRRAVPAWEIRAARDGSAAKGELLRDPKPSILVTDLDMPVMNGFRLIEWTRTVKELAPLRIVVFSGCVETYAQERCQRLAVDGYVTKTESFDALQKRISAIIAAGSLPDGPVFQ